MITMGKSSIRQKWVNVGHSLAEKKGKYGPSKSCVIKTKGHWEVGTRPCRIRFNILTDLNKIVWMKFITLDQPLEKYAHR